MRVAVIGAGVGGLTLALALHQRGVEVSAHDRADPSVTAGNGLGLAANGMRVLDALGVGPGLRHLGIPISAMHLRGSDGSGLARYDLGTSGLLGIRRADLTSVLSSALPGEIVQHRQSCVLVESGTGSAVATFADGSQVEADIIVGADGARSTIADYATGPTELHVSSRVALRALVSAEGLPPEISRVQIAWLGADRHFLSYPVDNATLVVAGFVPHSTDMHGMPETIALQKAFAGWNHDVTALTRRTDHVSRYSLADRDIVAPWTRGRVTLLGDAAHPMLPHTGQGANQAIEDAAVLSSLLTHCPATSADAIDSALQVYEKIRRPRTQRVQLQARHNGELFSGGMTRPEQSLRNPPDLSWLYDYDAFEAGREAADGACKASGSRDSTIRSR